MIESAVATSTLYRTFRLSAGIPIYYCECLLSLIFIQRKPFDRLFQTSLDINVVAPMNYYLTRLSQGIREMMQLLFLRLCSIVITQDCR